MILKRELLEGQRNFADVEARVLRGQPARFSQQGKQLPTVYVFEDQEKPLRILEGAEHVHNERMLQRLQNRPLRTDVLDLHMRFGLLAFVLPR